MRYTCVSPKNGDEKMQYMNLAMCNNMFVYVQMHYDIGQAYIKKVEHESLVLSPLQMRNASYYLSASAM